jgi:hypothetical protein
MIAVAALAAGLLGGSVVYTRKAWTLRVAASVLAAAGVGIGVAAPGVGWLAVAGAVLPIVGLLVLLGPPGSIAGSGPDWDPARKRLAAGTDPGTFHVPTRLLGAVDAYILLVLAVACQFILGSVDAVAGGGSGGAGAGGAGAGPPGPADLDAHTGIFVLSFFLSVSSVVLIGCVAAGRGIDRVRVGIRVAGLLSQVFLVRVAEGSGSGSGHGVHDVAVRVLGGIVAAVFSVGATL